MPDHTTTSAAAYLTERGYLVHSKRDGTDKPASPGTVKQWCERGKIKARKAGWVWLIEQKELDKLIKNPADNHFSGHFSADAEQDSPTTPQQEAKS